MQRQRKKAEIRLNRFYDYVLSIERDKLYYFTLAHNQKTLVISAPTDNKEQKTFLGYDWSNRKGAEGIIINKKGGQLYDDNDRFASNTLASLIRYTFYGDVDITLPKDVEKYAKTYWLEDMIDVKREQFDKAIKLSTPQSVRVDSKYELKALGDIAPYVSDKINYTDIAPNTYISTDNMLQNREGVVAYEGIPNVDRVTKYQKEDILVSNIRPYLKKIWFAKYDGGCNNDVIVFRNQIPEKCLNEYLYQVLSSDLFFDFMMANKNGMKMPRGDKRQIPTFPVPFPPLDIQQKIVDECKKVEEDSLESKRQIEILINQIDKIYNDSISTNTKEVKLSDICNMRAGKFVAAADIKDVADEKFKYPCYGGNGMRGYTDTMTNEGEYTIIGRQGALCGNVCTAKGQFHATEHAVVVYPYPDTDPVWLRYHLEKMNLNQYATGTAQPGLSVQKILELQCSIPLFETQKKVAEAIKKCEQDIQKAEEFCRSSYSRKQTILDKYLK